jgi:alkylation response protein AidB-like acyl-CoA dehydrogenase
VSEAIKTDTTQTAGLGDVDWVARAEAVAPQVEAAANQTEKGRRVTDDVMAALHEAQLFKMLLPRSLGGGEATPMEYTKVLEAIGGADGSTAWCLGQGLGCSLASARLDPEIAKTVFGPKNAVLAWGPARGDAKAIKVDGGYNSSGLWQFGSGLPHATWAGGHSVAVDADGEPIKDENGKPIQRTMLFPIDQVEIIDTWRVLGLRGTGSNNYQVKDQFVPEEYTLIRDGFDAVVEDGPLYRIPILTAYGIGFTGIALGLARVMMKEFIKLALQKKPSGFPGTLSENAVIQSEVSQHTGRLNAARNYLLETVESYWETLSAGDDPDLEQRALLRTAISTAMMTSRDVVDFAHISTGTNGIFEDGPFERRFRDIHTLTAQGQAHLSNFQFAGQALMGTTPDRRL